jgi:dihydrofolate synthase/folylpolyglutamate synthase
MNYEEALAFWFSRINYEVRSPQVGDLKLDRMQALLALLGNPHDRLRIVHVAGSKGKGSTAAMLAAMLRAAGYQTGLFTSPHLARVEERIQVNGEPVSAAELATLIGDVRPAVLALDAQRGPSQGPTFFEIATALGLLHFIRRRVDMAVLEVGLGGRFDSTNVCRPLVAVITSISFDHTQLLGNRLASIAREKAGIIKRGRPVVSGATAPEARRVIEEVARQCNAPLRQLGKHFHYHYEPGQVRPDGEIRSRVQIRTEGRNWPAMVLGLLGEHQAANAAVAVACIEQLRQAGLAVSDTAVSTGLSQVRWPARLEVVHRAPMLILDCAHNVASVQALVDTLRVSFPPTRQILIFAVSSDKNAAGMARVLAPQFAHIILTRYRLNPRSVAPEGLAEVFRRVTDVPLSVCASPQDAWETAQRLAGKEDVICAAGSVFLAGELRSLVLGN